LSPHPVVIVDIPLPSATNHNKESGMPLSLHLNPPPVIVAVLPITLNVPSPEALPEPQAKSPFHVNVPPLICIDPTLKSPIKINASPVSIFKVPPVSITSLAP